MHLRALPLAAIIAGGLLIHTPGASATDGTVLINQATATNGLPGCPASSLALITICNPGSYRLSGSLTVTTQEDGILITASDVSLDLNGFSIANSEPASVNSKDGIEVGGSSPANDVSISNGVIRGFYDDIFAVGQTEVVREVTALDAFITGIGVEGDAMIEDCQVKGSFVGVNLVDQGVGSSISGSLVAHNQYGIYMQGSGPSGYAHNVLLNNGSDVTGGISSGDNVCTSGRC